MTGPAGSVGLIVPVDVVAFCVGTTDAERTPDFAGTTIDYAALRTRNPQAFLGGSATRGLGNDALIPLEVGVHLHWALPDALTRAVNGTKGLDFPAVPNRWLITRLVGEGAQFTATSFVVAGDRLSAEAPSSTAMVIPVKPAAGRTSAEQTVPDFEYLGRSWPLADYPATLGGRSLREGTNGDLTAVANGVPSFAAYYPESRNSFGFWDEGVGLPSTGRLTYVVSGWYEGHGDPAKLEVRHGRDGGAKPLAQSHRWSGGPEAAPDYTLYSGFVADIDWDISRAYVAADPVPIPAAAALANSPSEALSAFFSQKLDLAAPEIEQLLTAFQQGLWPRLSQPQPAILARLAEALHDSQFRKIEGGTIYSIVQGGATDAAEAIRLPHGIAEALNRLNDAAVAMQAASDAVDAFRWRVFADWYRYFLTGSPNQAIVFTHLTQTLAPMWAPDGLQAKLADTIAARQAALEVLRVAMAGRPELTLREVPGPRFFQPTDPVVLLDTVELATPTRYGGDGAHRADGALACRSTSEPVDAVAIDGKTRMAADYAAAASLDTAPLPHRAELSALIAEACLLNADAASVWSGVARPTLDVALTALLAGLEQDVWTITAGTPPSPVAVTRWDGNPWLPIFLTWQVGFAPVAPTAGGRSSYAADVVTQNFTVDPAAGSFVAYTPADNPIDPARADYSATYRGYALLSAKAATSFADEIERLSPTDLDDTLKAILAMLRRGGFLVQPLAGFDDALLNQAALMQVAVVDPPQAGPNARLLTGLAKGVLDDGRQPITWSITPEFDRAYNPFRAGFIDVAGPAFSLVAVDAFGQRRPIQLSSAAPAAIACSMTATNPGGAIEPGFAYLAPRLAQPCRLMFQWIAAADGATREANDHPATTPICGWLLPNHLTEGFFLYDAAGRPIGSLFVGGDDIASATKIVWQGAPGNDADIDAPIGMDAVLAAADPQLRALALQLGTATSVADFAAFYAAVDAVHGTINPADATSDASLAVLIGRPVALVQATLRLELKGPPSLSQNSACFNLGLWTDSDAGLSGVGFPVALGDLDRLDDGLIGFFRQADAGGYDLGTFFSQATPSTAPRL